MDLHTPRAALAPDDPSTWRNDFYRVYVVQALPQDKRVRSSDRDEPPPRFLLGGCRWRDSPLETFPNTAAVRFEDGRVDQAGALRAGDRLVLPSGARRTVEAVGARGDSVEVYLDHRCRGVDLDAHSGVPLERRDALHAVYAHYLYPNMSVCRFRTALRGEYAADAVWEIDAHGELPADAPLSSFEAYLRAAVAVGRRIYVALTTRFGVDARYITTSISRMGCRVTVDWRAFGPRRLHEIFALVRYVEESEFLDGELLGIAQAHGIPELKIDADVYSPSDLPRPGADGCNAFRGPWLRPIGALHNKSSFWSFILTPVEHEMFNPDHVAWLTRVSRGRGTEWLEWRKSEGIRNERWPETRWWRIDRLIEDDPRPARPLIELLNEGCSKMLRTPEYFHKARAGDLRSRPRPAVNPTGDLEVSPERVEAFLHRLGVAPTDHPDRFDFDCPRAGCKPTRKRARVFKDSGVFKCFRCAPAGIPLVTLAAEFGLAHEVPVRRASQSPIARVPIAEVSGSGAHDDWGPYVEVIERTFSRAEEVWADRQEVLNAFYSDDSARILIDAADTGTGKTTCTATWLRVRKLRCRIFVERDDAKRPYLDLIPDAVSIEGRRAGYNCTNPELEEVMSRREPVAKTLCTTCPDRETCGYYRQPSPSEHNPVLAHGHGPHAALERFDNGADVDVVDEDALTAVIQNDDLDASELRLFYVDRGFVFPQGANDGIEDEIALGDFASGRPETIERRAASPRLQVILDRLTNLLTQDAIMAYDLGAAREGRLTDLALARYLFRYDDLRRAVLEVDEHDRRAHETLRLDLVHAQPYASHYVAKEDEERWPRSVERLAAISEARDRGEDETFAELGAAIDWTARRLRPLRMPDHAAERRPKNVLDDLLDALRGLYTLWATNTDRPARLQAYRADRTGSWVLRLTTRREFMGSPKIIHLGATCTPERYRLLYGNPTADRRWIVYRPKLPKNEERIVIADRSYGTTQIGKDAALRKSLFETVNTLIDRESTRTKLPVAVIGPSAVMNAFLREKLGDRARGFAMPFRSHERTEKMTALKDLTVPLGFIAGYAFAVAGSNEFSVEERGLRRFVRALVVLGNPVPNVEDVAREHRGLFEQHTRLVEDEIEMIGMRVISEAVVPDWRFQFRRVPFSGTEKDATVMAATNVPGFASAVANAVLYGAYEAQVLQIVGRLRGHLDDPVDPTVRPRVFIFAGLAIPGWHVDRVLRLDELRAELGLVVEEKVSRGRASKKSLTQQIQDRCRERGERAAVEWFVALLLKAGKARDDIPTHVRLLFGRAGIEGNRLVRFANAALAATHV
jgi:hypothetical protein